MNNQPSLIGQTIGNYKVVEQIGEGGMGVVFMAEHPVIGRKVAIKLLHASFAHDPETVARFFNEARAIHMIRHHNIVEILDFGQTTDGQPYFTMELLSGQSLAARIEEGPVPAAEAVAIVSQICDALQAAHDKNVIHRDLKPHNVYLVGADKPPEVKILDFGVAKMTSGWGETSESGGRSVKTRTGSLMGTPLYMSPEQCRGSGRLDHRTDIYSLAVILFEMISGRPPFVAEGVGELFAKHMLEAPPSLATLIPDTPPHIVRAVARALSKDIDDRFPDMKTMRAALNTPDAEETAADRDRDRDHDGSDLGLPALATAPGRGETASSMPVAQSTTFSSAASELDASLEDALQPPRSRKGLVLAGLATLAVVAGGVVISRRPDPSPALTQKAPAPAAAVPGTGVSPSGPPASTASTKVLAPAGIATIRIDATPATSHLFSKPRGSLLAEDLGMVPVTLELPRADPPIEYLLRADGHKERVVRVDPARDRALRFTLEPAQVIGDQTADKKPKPAERKPAAKPVRRMPVHDADGLAVPSF